LFERRVQGIGRGTHGLHDRVTRRLGRGPCRFAGSPCGLSGFTQLLALLPDCLERLALPVADLTGLLLPTA
jgi:hypothetical protein